LIGFFMLRHGKHHWGLTLAVASGVPLLFFLVFELTSILFNIPGEPWSVATTFDGFPMAQQGRAAQALTAAFTSSFVGAIFAVLLITFIASFLANFALKWPFFQLATPMR